MDLVSSIHPACHLHRLSQIRFASSLSIAITTSVNSEFIVPTIITCGACISSGTCAHSLNDSKLFVHLRYSSTSVDFKIGTFTSCILTLDLSLLFCSLIPSNASLSLQMLLTSVLTFPVLMRHPTHYCCLCPPQYSPQISVKSI